MLKYFYCLVNPPVGCIVDGWVDHWCSDVSLLWRKPNRNAAAFLHNLRNDQFLHRGLHTSLRHRSFLPQLTLPRATDALKYYSAPSYYTTKAPEYYTTTYASPAYYREAPKY